MFFNLLCFIQVISIILFVYLLEFKKEKRGKVYIYLISLFVFDIIGYGFLYRNASLYIESALTFNFVLSVVGMGSGLTLFTTLCYPIICGAINIIYKLDSKRDLKKIFLNKRTFVTSLLLGFSTWAIIGIATIFL